MFYGRLEIASQGGLFWILDTSRTDVVDAVARSLVTAPVAVKKTRDAAAEGLAALPSRASPS